jgi:hypothetical protein
MGLPCKDPGKDKRKPLVTVSNLLRVIDLNSMPLPFQGFKVTAKTRPKF